MLSRMYESKNEPPFPKARARRESSFSDKDCSSVQSVSNSSRPVKAAGQAFAS